jgi:hypothetical protein
MSPRLSCLLNLSSFPVCLPSWGINYTVLFVPMRPAAARWLFTSMPWCTSSSHPFTFPFGALATFCFSWTTKETSQVRYPFFCCSFDLPPSYCCERSCFEQKDGVVHGSLGVWWPSSKKSKTESWPFGSFGLWYVPVSLFLFISLALIDFWTQWRTERKAHYYMRLREQRGQEMVYFTLLLIQLAFVRRWLKILV